ncbi:MAG: IS1 family transposase [Candidatus Freyarchaeota archaeon]|nr:IS1 family transposase [Candidatus Jordarchaeia archaeon]
MELRQKKEAHCTPLETLQEEYGDHWIWVSFNPKHKLILAFVTGKISQENADQLIKQTKEKNDGSLHIFFSDQRPHYSEAILKYFGQPVQPKRKGTRGRHPKPRLEPSPGLLYVQIVKHRRKGRVIGVTTNLVFGTQEELQEYLARAPCSRRVNTAFVERQNNTLRHHNRRLTRKTLAFSKKAHWLRLQLHLCIGYYHFCLPHAGLREKLIPPTPTKGSGSPKKWRQMTPAMSAGVTDHVWSLQELLTYRIAPQRTNNIK